MSNINPFISIVLVVLLSQIYGAEQKIRFEKENFDKVFTPELVSFHEYYCTRTLRAIERYQPHTIFEIEEGIILILCVFDLEIWYEKKPNQWKYSCFKNFSGYNVYQLNNKILIHSACGIYELIKTKTSLELIQRLPYKFDHMGVIDNLLACYRHKNNTTYMYNENFQIVATCKKKRVKSSTIEGKNVVFTDNRLHLEDYEISKLANNDYLGFKESPLLTEKILINFKNKLICLTLDQQQLVIYTSQKKGKLEYHIQEIALPENAVIDHIFKVDGEILAILSNNQIIYLEEHNNILKVKNISILPIGPKDIEIEWRGEELKSFILMKDGRIAVILDTKHIQIFSTKAIEYTKKARYDALKEQSKSNCAIM